MTDNGNLIYRKILPIVCALVSIVALFGGCESAVSKNGVDNTTVSEKNADVSVELSADESFASDKKEAATTEEYSVSSVPTQSEKNTTHTALHATHKDTAKSGDISLANIPEYSGSAYVVLNSNNPTFKKSEITENFFESYSPLDSLGRCGTAFACLGRETMPTEERGSIGQVKPSGWHTVKYDCVDGKYLFNRCHLIGFQLSGENANIKNLITGTRYLNIEGMLPFENMVADYIKETNNHVMYRVKPIFEGSNLVASGVQMEAYSVEDSGDGICFNVYCYNVQPGVEINYSDGTSAYSGVFVTQNSTPKMTQKYTYSDNSKKTTSSNKTTEKTTAKSADSSNTDYVINTNTNKFHHTYCRYAKSMKDENKSEYTGNREDLIAKGYSPCGVCKP